MNPVQFITEGGTFMYAILALSIVAVAIILEKFFKLQMSYSHNGGFFTQVVTAVRAGDLNQASQMLYRTSHPLAKILLETINQAGTSKEAIQSAVQKSARRVLPGIQRRTEYLAMIGNVATLVGLLGTIQGLIVSFTSLKGAGAAEKAELLATGISTAMNTTAFGLIVAIPCVITYSIISNKESRIIEKYDEIISEVVHAMLHGGANGLNEDDVA